MPVAVTVACKCLAAHTTAERPVLEVLCLVQAVLEPVVAGEVAVAARVAAPSTRPLTATVCSQLVFRHQVRPAQRAADPLPLDRVCTGCQLCRAICHFNNKLAVVSRVDHNFTALKPVCCLVYIVNVMHLITEISDRCLRKNKR